MLKEEIKKLVKEAIREVMKEEEEDKDTKICEECKKEQDIQNFMKASGEISRYCYDCRRKHNKKRRFF